MSATNPTYTPVSIDYTGRDYYAIREQLISRVQDRIPEWTATNPSDFGLALVEAFAYMGDLMSYYIDRNINESFITTATQRDSVINIAQSYGYIPSGYRQAVVNLQFSNSSSDTTVVLPSGTIISGDVLVGDTLQTLYFTTQSDLTLDPNFNNGQENMTATEGKNIVHVSAYANDKGELVGTSDGTPNQVFELGETPVVDNSVEVYVQNGPKYTKWKQVQHIIDSGPTDQVFYISTDSSNTVYVNFGDGVSGAIPLNFASIRVNYTVGGGVLGNVSPGILTSIDYVPGLSDNDLIALQSIITVTNPAAAVGGSDPESLAQIRYSAPLTLRANTRAVTLQDFNSLALSVDNCGKANATATTWTSVTLYVAPVRNQGEYDLQPGYDENGTPNSEYTTLASNVESALSPNLLLGTSLTVQPPTYVDVVLELEFSKKPQYTNEELIPAITAALLDEYAYYNIDFASTIYQQDIETTVMNNVPGVKVARVTALHIDGGSGINTLVGAANEIFRFQSTNITVGPIV